MKNIGRYKKFCLDTMGIMAVIFIAMQIDTLSVMKQMKECLSARSLYYVAEENFTPSPHCTDIEYVVEKKADIVLPLEYNLRNMWAIDDDVDISDWEIKSSIHSVSLHNFFDGLVLVWYHVKATPPPNGHLKIGAKDSFKIDDFSYGQGTPLFYPAILRIHKRNGKWVVKSISERP